MQNVLSRKNIILALIVAITLLILFIAFDTLHFHLKGTTPSLSNVASSTVKVTFKFSQPVDSVERITINGEEVTSSAEVDGKTISIPFDVALVADANYDVVFSSITSAWFGNEIQSMKRSFTPKYVAYNKLSKEEQKAQVDASDSGQVNDEFIDNNVFPIITEEWQIEATVLNDDKVVLLTVKFFEEIPDYDNGGVKKQVPNSVADTYREEVLKEIKKRGGDPNNYTIIYQTNDYLYSKYNEDATH